MRINILPLEIPYLGKETEVELRIYPGESFYDSEGQFISASSDGTPIAVADCSVADGVITTEQITVDSTVSPTRRMCSAYTIAGIYKKSRSRVTSPLITILENVEVPESLGDTITWVMLDTTNNAITNYLRDRSYDVYNSIQVDNLIRDAIENVAIPNGSNTISGKVRLDVAAANSSLPVVVGANSPRLARNLALDFSNNLSTIAALTDDVEVAVTSLVNFPALSTNTTIPKNVRLFFSGDGLINIPLGKTLTIENGLGLSASPDKQIFAGSGNVLFNKTYPTTCYPEWFGAKGDNVNDDLPAFNKMLSSFYADSLLVGILQRGIPPIELGMQKVYYLSDTLHIRRTVRMYANGGDRYYVGSFLRFPKNKIGVVVHGTATFDGLSQTQTAQFSRFENFGILGENSDDNCIVDFSGLNITLKNSGAIKYASIYNQAADGHSVRADGAAVAGGHTVRINNFDYVISPDVSGTSTNNVIPIEKPRIYITANGTNTVVTNEGQYPTNTTDWIGSTMRINGANYTILSRSGNSFTMNAIVPEAYTWGEIQSVTTALTNHSARINKYHGFDPRIIVQATGLRIHSFSGNGVNLHSAQFPTAYYGSEPNNNLSRFDNVSCEFNAGSGFAIYGVNTQPIKFNSCTAEESGGWGWYEEGSSGIYTDDCHTSQNTAGTYRFGGASAKDIGVSNYSEGGQPGQIIKGTSMTISDINGAGTDKENGSDNVLQPSFYGGLEFGGGFAFRRRTGNFGGIVANRAVMCQMGFNTFPNTIFAFGAGEEAPNTGEGNPADVAGRPSYLLGYNDYETGLYNLYYGGNYGIQGQTLLGFTGDKHTHGAGHLVLPRGFYAGTLGGTRRNWQFVNAKPTTGTVSTSDIFWNNDAGAGVSKPLGWFATQNGDLAVNPEILKPFNFQFNRSGVAALVSGTVTVNDSAITANSKILITSQFNAAGRIYEDKAARVAGMSFVIKSSSNADSGDVVYQIIES